MAGSRVAKLRAMAEHPASNPHEAAIAAAEAARIIAAESAAVIDAAFAATCGRLPVRWVPDLRVGLDETWFRYGSAYETAARNNWRRVRPDRYDSELLRGAIFEAHGRHNTQEQVENAGAWLASELPPFQSAWEAGLYCFWIFGQEIVAVPQPSEMRNNGARLHSTTAAAVEWLNGCKFYFVRGVLVPESWVTYPEQLRPEMALTWPHLEQRRVAAEIIGWVKVIDRLPHRVLDVHSNPFVGTLLSVDLPDIADVHFLKVLCGTGRTFVLCVPRECRTAAEAQAAMWPGLTESEVLTVLEKGRRA